MLDAHNQKIIRYEDLVEAGESNNFNISTVAW